MYTFQPEFYPIVNKITLSAISTQFISYLYKLPTSILAAIFQSPVGGNLIEVWLYTAV